MAISLNELLDPSYGRYVDEDPDVIGVEAYDLLTEISELSMNATTFEAAKRIKAAKSKKKKVKVKKTKTTAKKARAMKKANKRAKVRREDDDMTGGTGPQSTSMSNKGLTETDHDVDPDLLPDDTPVVVVEPVTDGGETVTESTSLMFEDAVGYDYVGSDEMIIYEDTSILVYEDEQTKAKTGIWNKIKEFCKKIVDWICSLVRKIRNFFSKDRSLWDRVTKDGRLDKILSSSDKVIKIHDYKKAPFPYMDGCVEDITSFAGFLTNTANSKLADAVEQKSSGNGFLRFLKAVFRAGQAETNSMSIEKKEEAIKNFYNDIFGVDQIPSTVEKKIKDIKQYLPISGMEDFLFKLPDRMDKASKAADAMHKAVNSKSGETSDKLNEVREAASIIAKGVHTMNKLYFAIRADVRRLLSAADVAAANDERWSKD